MKKISDLQSNLVFIEKQIAQQRSLVAMLERQIRSQEERRDQIQIKINELQQQPK